MEAKLAALEEEISILKGEIKAILQEVRIAVLASENPFTSPSPRPHLVAVEAPEPESAPKVVQLSSVPPASEPDGDLQPAHEPAYTPPASPVPQQSRPYGHQELAASPQEPPLIRGSVPPRATTDIRALAALLAWVEETRERLDDSRYKVVLGLAAYGGILDTDLETTLMEAGNTFPGPAADARASMNDCIVALRQLEAILGPPPPESLRQLYPDNDVPRREVRPSRKQ